jgi:hypothetical protein
MQNTVGSMLIRQNAARDAYTAIFSGNLRIRLDATNPVGRTLDTSGSETYAALQNLAPGWGAESITNGTKASQPTSTNDAGTGLKGILMLGDSQLLSGNITAVNGDVFSWVVWRANGFVNNRQLISLSNSTAANQQWFSTPLGFLPMTSGFSADVFGAWHPNNYRYFTATVPVNSLISTTVYNAQANGGTHNLWRNNADFQTFSNTADRGALDRLGIGTALGSFRGPYTFFEFGLVTGNPTSGQRNALHALLQSKYTGL